MRKGTIIAIVSALSVLFLVIISSHTVTPDGAILFERERCINCHSFKGQGASVGPDLTDVAKRRNDGWLRDQIRDPKVHNPAPRMPPHEYLSRKEINAIIKYLKS